MMDRLLIIEDEPNVAAFIRKGLSEAGYEVLVAYDGPSGLALLDAQTVDLILLDVVLPGIDGMEICRRIRQSEHRHLPVLMLTALGSTDKVVAGLDSGADDYLAKPFKFQELLARVRALLRRKDRSERAAERILSIADLELNRDTKAASRAGKEIKLTATEYRLLEFFMKNPRRVLSRIDLLENVWDINFDMGTNVVDVYVNYLRNKVDKGFSGKLIHTVIGMGYVLKEER